MAAIDFPSFGQLMRYPKINEISEPLQVYAPFAPPLDIFKAIQNYNRDWDPEGDKSLSSWIMEIRQKNDFPAPYSIPMPFICDIDQTIFHVLYEIRKGDCPFVGDKGTFFTTIHAADPNQVYVLPERHISSSGGGSFYIYRDHLCPLSNTFPAPILWKGMLFNNVFHCVQAMKTGKVYYSYNIS